MATYGEVTRHTKRYRVNRAFQLPGLAGGTGRHFSNIQFMVGDIINARKPQSIFIMLLANIMRSDGQYFESNVAGPVSEIKSNTAINRSLFRNAEGDALVEVPGMLRISGALIGNLVGGFFAQSRGSGFWGYVFWIILGGAVGGAVGYVGDRIMPAK